MAPSTQRHNRVFVLISIASLIAVMLGLSLLKSYITGSTQTNNHHETPTADLSKASR